MGLDRSVLPNFGQFQITADPTMYDDSPEFSKTLGASFRQDNLVGSVLSDAKVDLSRDALERVDPDFDAFNHLEGYEQYSDRFEDAYNPQAVEAIKSNIDKEVKDRETLSASGWVTVPLGLGMSIADPTILIPGGAFAKGAKVGYRVGRSALSIGAAAALGTAVQEAGLQATQETRSGAESAINIGASAVLGGLIGAGGAKFFSKGEWDRVSASLAEDLSGEVANPNAVVDTIVRRMQSAGASAVDDIKLDDLGVGGPKIAQIVANATAAARINPGVQTMLSPSVRVREAYTKLVDNPIYSRMNMEGETLGSDVENLVKQYERGAMGSWLNSTKKTFRDAKKNGWQGTRTEFYEAVARAGRRGDVDPSGNVHVTKAAQEARSQIFDPLLRRAIENKLLPEDVKTTTAASYVTRFWNRKKLVADEEQFRGIARQYFSGELDKAVMRQEERQIGNKVVDSMFVEDRFNKAFERLSTAEKRLNERSRIRSGKLGRAKAEEARRFDVLKGRAPKELVDALRNAKADDSLVSFVKETRKVENIKRAKTPVLSILKKRGGVRIGSSLDANLRAIGVTPKTVPGLFSREGGRGAADNIVAREFDIFENIGVDENGYVLENDLIEAIRSEVSGAPLRSTADQTEIATTEAMTDNVKNWLESVGLKETSTISEIRAKMSEVLGRENALDDVDMKISRLNREIEEFDQITDKMTNEKVVTEAEAANVAQELRTLEDEINASYDLARSSPVVARMVDYAKARREFGSARYEKARLENRLEALRRVDADGRLTPEMDAEMRAIGSGIKTVDERIAKAEAKSAKLKPMLPKEKADIPDFIDPSDRNDYIEDIVTGVFNNLTGRSDGEVPEWLIPVTRGPLKERSFNIPDNMIEDFLENDMEAILRRYSRTMAAEVELTEKFGRADMKEQIAAIRQDYTDLRKAAKTPEERAKLNLDEDRDVKNLSAFRDMIRGTYRAADESSNWSVLTRTAMTWNYMRLLGGVTLSSLTDASRLIGVHGIRATMAEALPTLRSNLKAVKINKSDARELGAVTETVLQSRLASLADLSDPYRYGSQYERFLSNASNVFTKATGLAWWTDSMKMMASVMTQNRMMRNALDWQKAGKTEQAYMAYLGINEDMAERIAGQFKAHGMEERGIYGANVSKWDDPYAARAWAAALNKDVDRIVISKGVADTPLWMKTNWGRLIMQFKSFGLASHQRVLIAGLQERPRRLAEQIVFGTAIGMMISYVKMMERGDIEKANDLANNPGKWVADGLDRTGVLSLMFEVTNTADKIVSSYGGPNIGINRLFSEIAGDANMSGGSTRYASRNASGAILGPSMGILEDWANIASALTKGSVDKGAANAAMRQIPGASLPGVRTIMNAAVKPFVQDAVK